MVRFTKGEVLMPRSHPPSRNRADSLSLSFTFYVSRFSSSPSARSSAGPRTYGATLCNKCNVLHHSVHSRRPSIFHHRSSTLVQSAQHPRNLLQRTTNNGQLTTNQTKPPRNAQIPSPASKTRFRRSPAHFFLTKRTHRPSLQVSRLQVFTFPPHPSAQHPFPLPPCLPGPLPPPFPNLQSFSSDKTEWSSGADIPVRHPAIRRSVTMGQVAIDLPDPLHNPEPAPGPSADDLLAQLAGEEID